MIDVSVELDWFVGTVEQFRIIEISLTRAHRFTPTGRVQRGVVLNMGFLGVNLAIASIKEEIKP